MRRTRIWVIAIVLLGAWEAGAADYDPLESGNPIRVAAYALHPVGVILDYMIFRPAWWVGSKEPFRTLFGREQDPAILEDAMREAGTHEEAPETSAPELGTAGSESGSR
jgi:hypothetical protein